jgi:mannose-6-phosphate isomerase-like protein (cupin superfamily)
MEKEYPYTTILDVRHKPLELIDLKSIVNEVKVKWYNETLTRVNDSVVRAGIVEGEYHWHKHDDDDEFFFVVDGQLIIDLEDKSIHLNPWQGFTVPKGVVHRTRAEKKTVILMVETATIQPTGD